MYAVLCDDDDDAPHLCSPLSKILDHPMARRHQKENSTWSEIVTDAYRLL